MFDGDTNRILKSILEPSIKKDRSIEYIFINFPDPWFKDKHKKRRVVSQRFIDDIKQWLPSATKIIFQTDQEQLFCETQELLQENTITFKNISSSPLNAQTYWESMKIKEGETIYRMCFSL